MDDFRRHEDRPGCGCVGAVLSVMFALSILLVIAIQGMAPERDATGSLVESGQLGVTALRTGDCLTYDGLAEEVVGFNVVPCTEEHRAQVFATGSLPPGAWPGDDKLVSMVERRCGEAIAAKDAAGVDLSSYDLVTLRPVASGWVGDRGYTCLIVSPSGGSLTGDALVAGRV